MIHMLNDLDKCFTVWAGGVLRGGLWWVRVLRGGFGGADGWVNVRVGGWVVRVGGRLSGRGRAWNDCRNSQFNFETSFLIIN